MTPFPYTKQAQQSQTNQLTQQFPTFYNGNNGGAGSLPGFPFPLGQQVPHGSVLAPQPLVLVALTPEMLATLMGSHYLPPPGQFASFPGLRQLSTNGCQTVAKTAFSTAATQVGNGSNEMLQRDGDGGTGFIDETEPIPLRTVSKPAINEIIVAKSGGWMEEIEGDLNSLDDDEMLDSAESSSPSKSFSPEEGIGKPATLKDLVNCPALATQHFSSTIVECLEEKPPVQVSSESSVRPRRTNYTR